MNVCCGVQPDEKTASKLGGKRSALLTPHIFLVFYAAAVAANIFSCCSAVTFLAVAAFALRSALQAHPKEQKQMSVLSDSRFATNGGWCGRRRSVGTKDSAHISYLGYRNRTHRSVATM